MGQIDFLEGLFGLRGKVAVVTGATGVLGGAIARGLALAGARVAVLGRRSEVAGAVAGALRAEGAEAVAAPADVLSAEQLSAVRDRLRERWGRIDVLVNAAGGNTPGATVPDDASVFDVPLTAVREAIDLNLYGTLLPIQIFGPALAEGGSGSIVNVSSMAVPRALTRIMGYSVGKAAMENLTRWLAVELARRHGPGLRVNAVAPGFFLGDQNRALLIGPDGSPTPRGRAIVEHTPMSRFGRPEELVGAVVWLCSPAAAFVTGIVVPVDGGFSAFSGV